MKNNKNFTLTLCEESRLHINNELVPDIVLENHGLSITTKIINKAIVPFLCVPTNGNEAIVPSNTLYWNSICENILLESIALTIGAQA